MTQLQEGRIVHYVAFNNRHLAAIVIGVEKNGMVDLVLFSNMANVAGKKNYGLQFHTEVEYADIPRPGTWHWPEGAVGNGSVSVSGDDSVILTGIQNHV